MSSIIVRSDKGNYPAAAPGTLEGAHIPRAALAERAAVWEPLPAEQHVALAVTGPATDRVWAIPGALEQIVDNLLANALRVSPPGTTIVLARAPGPELHVVDQGPGMSETDRTRAFDRFWRASTSHHDGTGLGLPIVRHLVHASGGEITLDAAPGGGLDARIILRPAPGTGPRSPRPPRARVTALQPRRPRLR